MGPLRINLATSRPVLLAWLYEQAYEDLHANRIFHGFLKSETGVGELLRDPVAVGSVVLDVLECQF